MTAMNTYILLFYGYIWFLCPKTDVVYHNTYLDKLDVNDFIFCILYWGIPSIFSRFSSAITLAIIARIYAIQLVQHG